MINGQVSSARTPACVVTLNGEFVTWETVTVKGQNYYMADTYTIELPLSGNPQFSYAFWATVATAEIKIYMGFPNDITRFTANELTLIFQGGLDTINLSVGLNTVTLTGRDYAYLLIDKKITDSYVMQTASQIATQLAVQNGLTPVVTATTTPVGQYTYNEFNLFPNAITEWDLLTYLAQLEVFNLYVIRKELHFEPFPDPKIAPFIVPIQLADLEYAFPRVNVTSMNFGRTLTLASDVDVTIQSFSMLTGGLITKTATSSHVGQGVKGQKQKFVYSRPNLTPAQAAIQAQQGAHDITQWEKKLDIELPADVTLTKNTPVKITGTGTEWDQIYYIDDITRSLSAGVSEGFSMSLQMKNHSQLVKVTVT